MICKKSWALAAVIVGADPMALADGDTDADDFFAYLDLFADRG